MPKDESHFQASSKSSNGVISPSHLQDSLKPSPTRAKMMKAKT